MKAVIFDLDGVILSTDEYHFLAWKRLADELGIYFDRDINKRLRGVSRMDSLNIILERADKEYTDAQKAEMAEKKNGYYREYLKELTKDAVFDGVYEIMDFLRKKGFKLAIGSSSKNTKFILQKVGMSDEFDAVSDGTNITRSKPDPEVFVMAARMMDVPPENCFVVEDADAGIEAGKRAGMITIGVGDAQDNEKADFRAPELSKLDLKIFEG